MDESLREQLALLVKQYGKKRVANVLDSIVNQRGQRRVRKPSHQPNVQKSTGPARAAVQELLTLYRKGQFLKDLREYRQFVSNDDRKALRKKPSMAQLRLILEGMSDEQLAALIADTGVRANPFDAIVRSVVGEPRSHKLNA
jgi:hypothetical protein